MITGKTIALTIWTFVSKVMSLVFNMLSRFVIAFLLRSKCPLTSWLQSLSAVIFGAQENKVCHCFHYTHTHTHTHTHILQFSSVQLLSRVRLFATPWIPARQASLSITNSWISLRLTSIESVIPSSHLTLCHPLLLLLPIPPIISLFQWVNSSHEVAKVLEFQHIYLHEI